MMYFSFTDLLQMASASDHMHFSFLLTANCSAAKSQVCRHPLQYTLCIIAHSVLSLFLDVGKRRCIVALQAAIRVWLSKFALLHQIKNVQCPIHGAFVGRLYQKSQHKVLYVLQPLYDRPELHKEKNNSVIDQANRRNRECFK